MHVLQARRFTGPTWRTATSRILGHGFEGIQRWALPDGRREHAAVVGQRASRSNGESNGGWHR